MSFPRDQRGRFCGPSLGPQNRPPGPSADLESLKDPGSDAVKNKLYRRTVLDTSSFMTFFGFVPYASFTTDMVFEKNILAGAWTEEDLSRFVILC